jgi:outer membrane protein OmpA-like peptidoglycan-associated protein
MIRINRLTRVTVAALTMSVSAAAVGAQAPNMFTPLKLRTSDSAVAVDEARFDSAMAAVRGNARAAMYVALAREAYERNEDGQLATFLMAAAKDPARMPHGLSPALWALADSARGPAHAEAGVLALEEALVRSTVTMLGAPSCRAWQEKATVLAAGVRSTLSPKPVIAELPMPAPPVAVPEPAPAASVPAPPVTRAPRELRGIPSMVHFALDKHFLSPASQRVLRVLVDSLQQFPEVQVVLEGHTDPRASAAYNDALSRRRAASVRTFLLAAGVQTARISLVARGKSQLETEQVDVTSMARNRRVQLRYFLPDGTEIRAVQLLDDLQLEARGRRR